MIPEIMRVVRSPVFRAGFCDGLRTLGPPMIFIWMVWVWYFHGGSP